MLKIYLFVLGQKVQIACSIRGENLIVEELSIGTILPGSILRLRLGTFSNPIFHEALDGFVITTYDGEGGLIQRSLPFSITADQPAHISDMTLALSPNSLSSSNRVNERSQLLIDFAMPMPLAAGCTIFVKLPADFN